MISKSMKNFERSSNLLVNLTFLPECPTGLGVYALNLLPYLPEPLILAGKSFTNKKVHLTPSNLSSDFGSLGHARRLLWLQFCLPKICRQYRPSLLFSPVPESALFSSCRSIVTVHDLIPLRVKKRFSPLLPYFKYYVPQVLKRSEHIICDSQSTCRDVVDMFGISSKKITVIPLGYDKTIFFDRDLICGNHFLYIGRCAPHKNIGRLIQAFSRCKDQESKLFLVGSQPSKHTQLLKEQAKDLGVLHRIQFMPYVAREELPNLMGRALALVFPSLWEGFGLPVLEAMACGTPVITSNLSSLPEVAGDAAILIDPYNVEELAAAMDACISDHGLRAQLRRRGLEQAKRFSWSKAGHATASLLNRFL